MRGKHRACRQRQYNRGYLNAVVIQIAHHRRLHQGGSGNQRYRGRSLRHAHQAANQKTGHDNRQAHVLEGIGHRIANAGGAQYAAKHAARAGNQNHRENRCQRRIEHFFHQFGRFAAVPAQQQHAHQYRQQ